MLGRGEGDGREGGRGVTVGSVVRGGDREWDREKQGGERGVWSEVCAHTLSILLLYRERAKSQLARQQSDPIPQPFEIKL